MLVTSAIRTELVRALVTNLNQLVPSIHDLVAVGVNRTSQAVLLHRNALQQYVFLLHWLSKLADQQAMQQEAAASKGHVPPGVLLPGPHRLIVYHPTDFLPYSCPLFITPASLSPFTQSPSYEV